MMVRRVRTDRQRQAVAIHNSHDFHAISAAGRANLFSATLGRGKAGIDTTLRLVDLRALAKLIGQVRQRVAQYLVLAPLLEAAMRRLIVRIGLRQHAPLGAGIEDPQRCVKHFASQDRLAARTLGWIALSR